MDLFRQIIQIKKANHLAPNSPCTWHNCVCTEWKPLQNQLDEQISHMNPSEFQAWFQQAQEYMKTEFVH